MHCDARASPYKDDASVQQCPSVRYGAGASHVTDSPPHATPRHAASSAATARSWLGLAGMGEGGPDPPPPRPGLVLMWQCARLTRTVRLFCPPPPHAPTHTPKIDNGASPYKEDVSVQLCPSVRCGAGASHVTDSPPHATPQHAASSPATARL